MSSYRIKWLKSTPFLLMHLTVFAAFLVPFRWEWVGLCVASYYLRMFAITAGYHRYFSHRSYKMNRVAQFIMAFLGGTALQKGALWWAANHRLHHKNSDQPSDIHSPVQHGFWWSHVGWIMSDLHEETHWNQIQDLAKYPELRWLNHYHVVPGIIYALALFAVGGWGALIWGFFISTVLLWHGTFTINSLSHVFGSVRYKTTDTSRNNFWLALVTLGEGWHNNHHCYMSSTRQGFFWWEIDGSYYALKALSWFGIVRDLRNPPLKLLESKLLKPSLRTQTPTPLDVEIVQKLERA
jgi:stearoyl-CoA desaturase (Delta-9 desaturase)